MADSDLTPQSNVDLSNLQPDEQQPNAAEQESKREAEAQMRRDLLATVLDSAARERRLLHSFHVSLLFSFV